MICPGTARVAYDSDHAVKDVSTVHCRPSIAEVLDGFTVCFNLRHGLDPDLKVLIGP
jgi:hypothetical protein